MNKLLTGSNRDMYNSMIKKMFKMIPDMMARKIPEANVQQAFVARTVLNVHKDTHDKILCVGSYDDTAYEFLLKLELGLSIIGIDPDVNYSLHEYKDLTTGHFNNRSGEYCFEVSCGKVFVFM